MHSLRCHSPVTSPLLLRYLSPLLVFVAEPCARAEGGNGHDSSLVQPEEPPHPGLCFYAYQPSLDLGHAMCEYSTCLSSEGWPTFYDSVEYIAYLRSGANRLCLLHLSVTHFVWFRLNFFCPTIFRVFVCAGTKARLQIFRSFDWRRYCYEHRLELRKVGGGTNNLVSYMPRSTGASL